MTLTILDNARVFDGVGDTVLPRGAVLIEGDTIREVGEDIASPGARRIDLGGRFLMPGLIDAHYHANTPSYDFYGTDRMEKAHLAAHAAKMLRDTLHRGYTSVRDAGGGDQGLALAIEEGLIDGPRFFYPGRAMTQTGGHGDMRKKGWVEPCGCASGGVLSQCVDGADAMRHAVREEFRKGATHIKIFLSGGVSTALAPLAMPHFTDAEIAAAVEEAARRRSYVMAHCHTDDGARRALRLGIRSIEHGSMIVPATAALIAAAGAYVVPTLAAGAMIAENIATIGLPAAAGDRIREVNAMAREAVAACAAAGVKLGLGCDLHGHGFLKSQGRELALRAELQPPLDVLRSATSVNAEIVQMAGRLGVIAPGALADLIAVDGEPDKGLALFARAEEAVALVMKGGRVVRSRV